MQTYIRNHAAPLHLEANMLSAVVAFLPQGLLVYATYHHGDWCSVTIDGQNGYMRRCDISFNDIQFGWSSRYGAGAAFLHQSDIASEQVKNIQTDLILYFSPVDIDLDATGIFDFKTFQMLLCFQQTRGLSANGIATPKTKAALFAACQRIISEKQFMELCCR